MKMHAETDKENDAHKMKENDATIIGQLCNNDATIYEQINFGKERL